MTTQPTMLERLQNAAVAAIMKDCTSFATGECYAIGDADGMEIDGEFCPILIVQAILDELATPSMEMREAGKRAYLCEMRSPMQDFSVGCGTIFSAMITAARDEQPAPE